MIQHCSYISIIVVLVIYTFYTNTLLTRNRIFLKSEKMDETHKVPERVLVYIENNDILEFTNVKKELLKEVKSITEDGEHILPSSGVYKFTVSTKDGKKTIIGIPA